jgi:hypothetical protein
VEYPRDQVARAARQDSDWYGAGRERTYDFHHSAVAAEREHGVVAPPALISDLGCVARSFRQHDIAGYATAHERSFRLRPFVSAAPRPRIDDE